MKHYLFMALLLLTACQSVETSQLRGVTTIETLESGGRTRSYRLRIPSSYNGDAMPLLVSIHGFSSDGTRQEQTSGASEIASREGFFVVYPEGLGRLAQGWNITRGSEDVIFIRELVAHLQSEFSIDAKRIYATGHSNGGGMVNRLACDATDLFAAVAPVSGAYTSHQQCEPSRAIALIIFHAIDDRVVPYNGSFQTPQLFDYASVWAARNECESTPHLTLPHEQITLHTWDNCNAGVTVALYSLDGTGHSWPGSQPDHNDINASETIWEFLKRYSLPPGGEN